MKDIYIDTKDLDYTKPITYYCSVYGLSENALRNRFKNLGIYDKFIFTKGNVGNVSIIKSEQRQLKYKLNPKICPNCNSIIEYKNRKNSYCSRKCASTYIQKDGGNCHWNIEDRIRISKIAKEKNYVKSLQRNFLPKVNKKCKNCNKEYNVPNCYKDIRNFCSHKCYYDWANKTGYLKGKSGGYRIGAGRGKSGWYKGIFCNSSYELAWVLFNLEHGIRFVRNTNWFEYVNSIGNRSKYYPDYKLLDSNEYVEIKGYKEKEFLNKTENFPEKLVILDKEKMKPILNFVKEKYGKSFISLYEGNPHNNKNNKCLICGKSAKNKYCSRICSGHGVKNYNKI